MPSSPTLLSPSSPSPPLKESEAYPLAQQPRSEAAAGPRRPVLSIDTAGATAKGTLAEPSSASPLHAGLRAPGSQSPGLPAGEHVLYQHAAPTTPSENGSMGDLGTVRLNPASPSHASVAESHASSQASLHEPKLAADAKSYLEATLLLRDKTKFARKAMPMVLHSAGFGLMLAGAIHMPVLLLVAPLLILCGMAFALPAGWALAKFMQWRAARTPEVQGALQTLDGLRAQDDFDAIRELAHGQVKASVADASTGIFPPRMSGKKLDRAEAFARGEKIFEAGARRALTGPYKFWKRHFTETTDSFGEAFAKTRMGAMPSAATTPQSGAATPESGVTTPVETNEKAGTAEKRADAEVNADTKA